MFWIFGHVAHGIFAPWPAIEAAPPALKDEIWTFGTLEKSPCCVCVCVCVCGVFTFTMGIFFNGRVLKYVYNITMISMNPGKTDSIPFSSTNCPHSLVSNCSHNGHLPHLCCKTTQPGSLLLSPKANTVRFPGAQRHCLPRYKDSPARAGTSRFTRASWRPAHAEEQAASLLTSRSPGSWAHDFCSDKFVFWHLSK